MGLHEGDDGLRKGGKRKDAEKVNLLVPPKTTGDHHDNL